MEGKGKGDRTRPPPLDRLTLTPWGAVHPSPKDTPALGDTSVSWYVHYFIVYRYFYLSPIHHTYFSPDFKNSRLDLITKIRSFAFAQAILYIVLFYSRNVSSSPPFSRWRHRRFAYVLTVSGAFTRSDDRYNKFFSFAHTILYTVLFYFRFEKT